MRRIGIVALARRLPIDLGGFGQYCQGFPAALRDLDTSSQVIIFSFYPMDII